ncbi:MAG: hypothetical protein RLZZ420_1720, partial [Bacteroidota bacterium]
RQSEVDLFCTLALHPGFVVAIQFVLPQQCGFLVDGDHHFEQG